MVSDVAGGKIGKTGGVFSFGDAMNIFESIYAQVSVYG